MNPGSSGGVFMTSAPTESELTLLSSAPAVVSVMTAVLIWELCSLWLSIMLKGQRTSRHPHAAPQLLQQNPRCQESGMHPSMATLHNPGPLRVHKQLDKTRVFYLRRHTQMLESVRFEYALLGVLEPSRRSPTSDLWESRTLPELLLV